MAETLNIIVGNETIQGDLNMAPNSPAIVVTLSDLRAKPLSPVQSHAVVGQHLHGRAEGGSQIVHQVAQPLSIFS